MTSEQISALRQKFELDTSMQSDLMQTVALLEIAYQLARFNEREEAKERRADAWRVAGERTTGRRV
jgi:hypothetical protein